ncbi:metal ABC transporter permease [Paucilactobacillus wasatchensis]|uniref:Zinc ABC transporter, inner membrane permease protein n=1 Tax=Paucilactobacillus wasatchensis TaxID=1335616 RepID=A0A0D0Y7C1_9LACO|nr:metal ABC transporter permease [Paucilactobacillus wasatchensis]KIS04158.1 Zinc ABC transporter, inner membrane permease protein [Paucilactobacillus wasatchensis]
MFSFDFMRHAFMAGTFIGLICGIIGVFVIARSMSFLTHTLSEIGFAGAAFGVFAGWAAINGMLLFTIVSSVIVGQMSVKESRRESAITAVSALFIGLGILFLSLSNQNASSATSILFGSVIGISLAEVWQIIMLSVVVLIVIFLFYRSLKFDSFDAVGARVNGVKSNLISVIFLVLLALSVSVAAQIVGSLLIFILLTLPAASAKYYVHSVAKMMALSVVFALVGTWCGLYLGYLTNWPVSFFIAALEVLIYCGALVHAKRA